MTDQIHSEGSGLLLLHPDDNVLIVSRYLAAGSTVEMDGSVTMVRSGIELGHKLARIALAKGTIITRYGAPIGTLTADVAAGEHVHSHNLTSNYIAAHDRDAAHNEGRNDD